MTTGHRTRHNAAKTTRSGRRRAQRQSQGAVQNTAGASRPMVGLLFAILIVTVIGILLGNSLFGRGARDSTIYLIVSFGLIVPGAALVFMLYAKQPGRLSAGKQPEPAAAEAWWSIVISQAPKVSCQSCGRSVAIIGHEVMSIAVETDRVEKAFSPEVASRIGWYCPSCDRTRCGECARVSSEWRPGCRCNCGGPLTFAAMV